MMAYLVIVLLHSELPFTSSMTSATASVVKVGSVIEKNNEEINIHSKSIVARLLL